MTSKTNLAYINTATESAVDKELKDPKLSTAILRKADQVSLKIVAGFTIHDEKSRQQALSLSLAARRQTVTDYRKDRDSVKERLTGLGISPLAVVPKTAWEHICTKSELFMLAPDGDGRIRISTSIIDELNTSVEGSSNLISWIFYILAVVGANLGLLSMGLTLPVILFTSMISIAVAIYFADKNSLSAIIRSNLVSLRLWQFTKRPWKAQLNALLRHNEIEQGLLVRVMLPEPPADVAAILTKAIYQPIKVAAVAEAISFANTSSEILRSVHGLKIKEARSKAYRGYASHQEWLEKCPIIYLEYGKAVAVIAQFGDFPVEKEVVDKIINSEYLL